MQSISIDTLLLNHVILSHHLQLAPKPDASPADSLTRVNSHPLLQIPALKQQNLSPSAQLVVTKPLDTHNTLHKYKGVNLKHSRQGVE